jgi:RNA polymerase sigma-70 factor (ECF subfamily)
MRPVQTDSEETVRLLGQLAERRGEVFPELFERHRRLLEGVIRKRLDARLLARADSSDVLQETQLEAYSRIDDYLDRRPMPFRLWLLKNAYEQIRRVERQHLEAAKRTVDRQLPLPEKSTLRLAVSGDTPSSPAQRSEVAARVRTALAKLSEQDRELVMLRNFEDLSNNDVAILFEISPDAARKRYRRALLRLQDLLGGTKEGQ